MQTNLAVSTEKNNTKAFWTTILNKNRNTISSNLDATFHTKIFFMNRYHYSVIFTTIKDNYHGSRVQSIQN